MPCQVPELKCPFRDRDCRLHLGHRASEMRRHIIGAFVVVAVTRRVFRGEPGEKRRKVVLHLRRVVLLDQQRGRGMRDEDRQQPAYNPLTGNPSRNLAGYVSCGAVATDTRHCVICMLFSSAFRIRQVRPFPGPAGRLILVVNREG